MTGYFYGIKSYFIFQMRAKSALIRKDPSTVQVQMDQQQQKSKILEEDRKNFHRQAEEVKERHREEIEKLKSQNTRLKNLRDDFIANRKRKRGLTTTNIHEFSSVSINNINSKDENYLRRLLDKEKYTTKNKKSMLFNLQDKLKEVEENKLGYIEENPLMRNVRVLENRLDKVMIKYNEAQSVQKTYEEVLKRLREERVGYDSQLAIIQNSLKGKQHDFQELLLLAHDAAHAKEAAYAQLKRFEQRRVTVQQMRSKYITEKRNEINKNAPIMKDQAQKIEDKKTRKTTTMFANNFQHDESYQKQQLNDYQEAFRKLKEVTGVLDANQIIQKFKTQGLTTSSLEELEESYKQKIEELKQTKEKLKKQLEENKFVKENGNGQRRRVDEIETEAAHVSNQHERALLKSNKISNVLISLKAGVEHLKDLTAFYKKEKNENKVSEVLEDDLKVLNDKLRQMCQVVSPEHQYAGGAYKEEIKNLMSEREEAMSRSVRIYDREN